MALSPRKGAPNLYEVLKDALKKQERERAARQAAEPAAEPAVAEPSAPIQPSVFSEPPQPEKSETVLLPAVEAAPEEPPRVEAPEPMEAPEPDVEPAPAPEPAPEPVVAAASPIGERSMKFSYNTMAFAGLIGLASLFAAYSAGLHRGRNEPAAPVEDGVAEKETSAAVEPGWRLRVMEWPARGPAEERGARANAQSLTRGLTSRGFIESAFAMQIVEKPTSRVLRLYYGNFPDAGAPEAAQWRALLESYRDRSFDLSRSVALERAAP